LYIPPSNINEVMQKLIYKKKLAIIMNVATETLKFMTALLLYLSHSENQTSVMPYLSILVSPCSLSPLRFLISFNFQANLKSQRRVCF